MRKTKIVVTIGPSTDDPEILWQMAKKYSVNLLRINFSHGTHEEHARIIKNIQDINKKLFLPFSILVDLQGPVIRTGIVKENFVLKENDKIVLTTKDLVGTKDKISISYKKLPKSVEKGTDIYIADGLIELKVEEVQGEDIFCKVVIGGEIGSKKNINIPGIDLEIPAISEKDIADIEFFSKYSIDFVAQSFVRKAKDVVELRKLLRKNKCNADIIAKIECEEALRNIDSIMEVADGIMIARGDLGVQIPIEEIPLVQKMLIKKANRAGKPVITATQMLESMIKNPRPTRAEVTDIANAILDGTDCLMLSGETTIGKYPLKVVEMMSKISMKAEEKMKFKPVEITGKLNNTDAIAKAVYETAHYIDAKAIITCTHSGFTAREIAKYKPKIPIIAATPNEEEFRKLNIYFGVRPVLIKTPKNTDDLINYAINSVKEIALLRNGDLVILTAGIPFAHNNTNIMKIHVIE